MERVDFSDFFQGHDGQKIGIQFEANTIPSSYQELVERTAIHASLDIPELTIDGLRDWMLQGRHRQHPAYRNLFLQVEAVLLMGSSDNPDEFVQRLPLLEDVLFLPSSGMALENIVFQV